MTISSSLNAGVSGLNANATRLATISDNIANSATNGYKRSQVEFSSLVVNQRQSTYSAGGVQANAFKDVAALGSLISTGNSTDIAVSGRGLFPVTDVAGVNADAAQRDLLFSPTASFSADEDGNLRTQSGLFLLGWPVDQQGEVGSVSRNSGTSLEPVNIAASQFVASPTGNIELGINLPADSTAAGAPPDQFDLPVEYFDNLGRAHNLRFEFTPVIPPSGFSNEWNVEIFDDAGDPAVSIGDLNIEFDSSASNGGRIDNASAGSGASYAPATGIVSLTLAHGPVEVFIGRPNDVSGITQLSAPFAPTSVVKDGAPIGDLQTIEVTDEGFIQAIYDTGFRRNLFQIPVGDVPNLNGLNARDSQSYSLSSTSGDLYLWDAGTGPVGALSGFTLMESTTDIATELTDLIETQRAYSSNATLIQTVDEMLQETANLKR